MTEDEKDRALRAALDDDASQDLSPAARAAAVRDVAAIRRGLALLADQAHRPAPARAARRTRWRLPRAVVAFPVSAAAAALLVAGIVSWSGGGTGHHTAEPPPASTIAPAQPPYLPPQEPPTTLQNQVTAAERIVVGTVGSVRVGKLADTRYVLARIRVTQSIKGPAGDVVALAVTGPVWRVGDRLLLFLTTDNGATTGVLPRHLRVTDDKNGWYPVKGDKLAGTGFTVQDVRDLAG